MNLKWAETHKHLLMAILAAVVLLLCYYKAVAHFDGVAHDQRVLAEAQLAKDKDAQKAADKKADNDFTIAKETIRQKDAENANLKAQNALLRDALASRQAQDRTLPPPELATRHIELVGLLPGDVKAVPEGILSNLDAERKTVVMLEEVPALRQTVKNQDGIIANDKQELGAIQIALNSANAATDACKVTLKSQETACEAEKKEIKAKARKHGFWYTLLSFLGGVAAGSRL